MATQKIDSILLGRGALNDNAYSPAFFTSNSPVDYWSNSTTYAQYNCVEHGGIVYRSKTAGNLGNTPSSSPANWEVLYKGTKDGDFAVIIGSGATLMQRQGGFWLVFGNHPAKVIIYDEIVDVIAPAPSNDNEIQGPVTSGTFINLPLDSRESNSTEKYIVGSGDLEIRLNGIKLVAGDDWLEVGALNAESTAIQINYGLVVGDRLVFRRLTTQNITGYGGGGGGGGGSGTLQDAYDNGKTISVASGQPMTLTGTGKVAQFNGDIGVTGVIDPQGITFTREPSDPLPANQDGFWVDSIGELHYRQYGVTDVNLSQISGGNVTSDSTVFKLNNNTGSTIAAFTPVSLNGSGELKIADMSVENDADTFVGITAESIADGSSGKVLSAGRIQNITTPIALGSPVYVSKTGTLTATKPDIGVAGFTGGDWVVKVGMVCKNTTNPAQKDIIINSSNRGQL